MKLATIVSCCFLIGMMAAAKRIGADGQEGVRIYATQLVHIAPHFVSMPIGRIVLIRRGSEYCAVKFAEAWKGKTESARFQNYESYYQGDGTGDFSNENVQFAKDTLVDRQSVLGRLYPVPFGHRNLYIKCGAVKLLWSDSGTLYFSESPGRGGVELAPTKWTDIFHVNVFDPRLKWYRYDEKRKDMFVPVDRLWEDDVHKK